MRWPRRGILIRLAIYVPVISFLVWRAQGGCESSGDETKSDEIEMEQKLAPHRKVITLPDGTQQEIVELTQEEAEQILGHPIPRDLEKMGEAKAGAGTTSLDAKTGADVKAGTDVKPGTAAATSDAKAGSSTTSADAKTGTDAKPGTDAKAAEPRP